MGRTIFAESPVRSAHDAGCSGGAAALQVLSISTFKLPEAGSNGATDLASSNI
ncbi:hypothetical protein ACTHPF_21665 [Paenibacillus sp. SAF-054]|uniref:hypothetical protein n=1 Tax=unclassified Paenibacillus TaxID=185978 RepID=UPI003F7DF7D0